MVELNRCKSCGFSARIQKYISDEPYGREDYFQVTCGNLYGCTESTEWFDSKDKAIEAWNAMNSEEMEACPFCRTPFDESNMDTRWVKVGYVSRYRCDGCYCQMLGEGKPIKGEAVKSLKQCWNTRKK